MNQRLRTLFVAALFAALLFTTAAQAQWRSVTGPRPPKVVSVAQGATTLFLGSMQHDTGGPVYRSLDGGQTWLLTNGSTPLRLFPHHDGVVYGGGFYVGLWRSLDDGVTWARVAGGLPTNGSGVVLAACGDALFAAVDGLTNPERLYRSTNDGASWSALAGGLPVPTPATDARCLGTTVLAAVGPEVYRSTNGGTTWAPVGTGLPAGAWVDVLAQGDGAFWAGVSGDAAAFGVYRSVDDGQTWARVGLALAPVASLRFQELVAEEGELLAAVAGQESFDSGDAGLHRSTDGGQTWTRVWNGSRTRRRP